MQSNICCLKHHINNSHVSVERASAVHWFFEVQARVLPWPPLTPGPTPLRPYQGTALSIWWCEDRGHPHAPGPYLHGGWPLTSMFWSPGQPLFHHSHLDFYYPFSDTRKFQVCLLPSSCFSVTTSQCDWINQRLVDVVKGQWTSNQYQCPIWFTVH